MTERLFIEACVVDLPLRLSPVGLASKLSPRSPQALGKFITNVCVRYQPDVSTATEGVAALGLTTNEEASLTTISANQPHHIGPVWKPATLILPKDRLNLQEWASTGSPAMYLVGIGIQGHVTITCTLKLTLNAILKTDPLVELVELNTPTYVGPVLEGFSYVCCAPFTYGFWNGVGPVINIDLTRATGVTTASNYGLRTPSNKPYVAVRYGFGSSYTYSFNKNNHQGTWKSNTQVIYSYTEQNVGQNSLSVSYFASWRPINGSTDWWCEINPSYTPLVGQDISTWYYPVTQLMLYYHFPGVDIFDPDFTPGIACIPGDTLPCPPGEAVENQPQLIPLNMGRNQQLWSPWWRPNFGAEEIGQQLQYRFSQAKYALTKWPINCDSSRHVERQLVHSRQDGDKTLIKVEEAWHNVDA